MTAAFLIACGVIEVWTLWKGLNAPDGKAWPWFTACVLDCALAIGVGTWLAFNAPM